MVAIPTGARIYGEATSVIENGIYAVYVHGPGGPLTAPYAQKGDTVVMLPPATLYGTPMQHQCVAWDGQHYVTIGGIVDIIETNHLTFVARIMSAEVRGFLLGIASVEEEGSLEDNPISNARRAFVTPILELKGWSILDWAVEANVAHATAMDYLLGKTNPFRSTRLKLAQALSVSVSDLPR